jgi:serine/threonine protein kinase
VKILPRGLSRDPSSTVRFVREAQIIARLNHPQIVQIYDAGQHDGVLYFVMEYVQGPTVSSLLQLDDRIPQHLAAEYIAQVADALDAAYKECQIIHRDLKPENLILDRWGRLKVMDFGLARALGLPPITSVQSLVGSLYYASPEQIRGWPLDHRSDIYALGIVLYEMVTGTRPFLGRTLQEVAQVITAGRVLPPTALIPDLSPELEQIIVTAMAIDREQRFAQAGLMAEELRALRLHPPSAGSMRSLQNKDLSGALEASQSTSRWLPPEPEGQHPTVPVMKRHLTLPMREPRTPIPGGLTQNETSSTERDSATPS